MTGEEVNAWVAESRAAQGLGPTISDSETIAQAAAMVADALIRQGGPNAGSTEPTHAGGAPSHTGRRPTAAAAAAPREGRNGAGQG